MTEAPSAIAHGEGWPAPKELGVAEIKIIVQKFAEAAQRAARIGFDVVELHAAHGYLIHQFLSPLSNQRKDAYGQNRSRFLVEVAEAVRAVWPKERALGARITANDWVDGGLGAAEGIAFARELQRIGFDYVCVTTGALTPTARIPVAPGFQVPFAEKVKKAVEGLPVRTVGMIADPLQAEEIVSSGKADMVAMARAFLDNPRWVWHAAERFGVKIDYPPPYARAAPDVWPGARIARQSETA
jgi:NADPH2 dehydrogenase